MPPEGTTQTDPPAAPVTTPLPSAAVETPVSPREFNALAAQAAIQEQVEKLKAQYAGLYGWALQQKQAFDASAAAKDATVADLNRQMADVSLQLVEAKKKLGDVETVQSQLTTKTTEATALQTQLDRQKLLMKFPALLAVRSGEGENTINPVLDLALASNLPLDQLERQLTGLAATFNATTPPTGYPPMPPQSGAQDDTPEGYQKQAREWHDKAIHGPAAEREAAEKKSQEFWALAKKTVKK